MTRNAADVVMGAGGLERDGSGAAAIGGYGVAGGACFVVVCAHFIHAVAQWVVEHCKLICYTKQINIFFSNLYFIIWEYISKWKNIIFVL